MLVYYSCSGTSKTKYKFESLNVTVYVRFSVYEKKESADTSL